MTNKDVPFQEMQEFGFRVETDSVHVKIFNHLGLPIGTFGNNKNQRLEAKAHMVKMYRSYQNGFIDPRSAK